MGVEYWQSWQRRYRKERAAAWASADDCQFLASPPHKPSDFGDKIYIVKLMRIDGNLTHAMNNDPGLEQVRTAASQSGKPCNFGFLRKRLRLP